MIKTKISPPSGVSPEDFQAARVAAERVARIAFFLVTEEIRRMDTPTIPYRGQMILELLVERLEAQI